MGNDVLTVQLKGGLGNQMFQYAAGRALAKRSGAELYVDGTSGFARDKVYRRTFDLAALPIRAPRAGLSRQAPYWLEKVRERVAKHNGAAIQRRPWGTLIREERLAYDPAVAACAGFGRAWMDGYWQTEKYFEDARELLAAELEPPAPAEANFRALGDRMSSCQSVAVGVRLFEEVPGDSKSGLGGVVPLEFYSNAAHALARRVESPVFFVFCTHHSPQLDALDLPGETVLVTHDDGYNGTLQRLWLLTRCRHHILSNSSFYWWGAWLAERRSSGATVIASEQFMNVDCVPERWRVPVRELEGAL